MLERPSDGRGGEADLVVDHDVQRAAGRIAGQLAEIERLLHDPFAGKSRVAVNQQRHGLLALGVAAAILLGADAADGHRD